MGIPVLVNMMEETIQALTPIEVSQENWHKCSCHYLENSKLFCKRCEKCVQRAAIVFSHKMTTARKKDTKIDSSSHHTKLEEVDNKAQWVKHQRLIQASIGKEGPSWDEEVFKRQHPEWSENPDKKGLTIKRVLGRLCEECGEPVPKWAMLDLCEEHRRIHIRNKWRERKRRQRARNK